MKIGGDRVIERAQCGSRCCQLLLSCLPLLGTMKRPNSSIEPSSSGNGNRTNYGSYQQGGNPPVHHAADQTASLKTLPRLITADETAAAVPSMTAQRKPSVRVAMFGICGRLPRKQSASYNNCTMKYRIKKQRLYVTIALLARDRHVALSHSPMPR
jgi:hypothetical protein